MSTLIVTGRIGSDAELRTMQDSTKVASFSVADDIGYGDKKKTQWIKCALFGKRAESLAPHLTKGSLVEVIGSPSVNQYESKGQHRADLQVRVIEVNLKGGGKKDEPVADKGRATRGQAPADLSDDIPFAPEWR